MNGSAAPSASLGCAIDRRGRFPHLVRANGRKKESESAWRPWGRFSAGSGSMASRERRLPSRCRPTVRLNWTQSCSQSWRCSTTIKSGSRIFSLAPNATPQTAEGRLPSSRQVGSSPTLERSKTRQVLRPRRKCSHACCPRARRTARRRRTRGRSGGARCG